MIRRRVVVHGRVQGVGFRASCEEAAARLGVSGWARNLEDGTVEVVAEGPQEPVDALIAWVRQGPRLAEVTGVDIEEQQPAGLRGFTSR